MERLTLKEGLFCNIAQCSGPYCRGDEKCDPRRVYERLREYEDEAEKRENGCEYCGLIYETSRENYDIPAAVDTTIENKYCPMCGKRLRE